MEEIKNTIIAVLHTMDQIPITGHENHDRFLGCYQHLERCVHMLEEQERSAAVEQPEAGEE